MAKKSDEDGAGDAPRSAGKTSRSKSESDLLEPRADWLTIGRAIFRFGITPTEAVEDDASPFSVEAFEKSKKRKPATDSEAPDDETKPNSIRALENILTAKTHARSVKIDQEGGRFTFCFDVPSGGASITGGSPWEILSDPGKDFILDPRVEAEALFNKEGLVRFSEKEASYDAEQNKALREVTGLVWRRFMLPAFDRSVSAGKVKIYARVHSAMAPFQALPSTLWPLLEVLDWQHGIARDLEGALYYSLHATGALFVTPKQQSISAYEKAATKALAAALKVTPAMRRAEAKALLKSMKFPVSNNGFQTRVWPSARKLADLPPRGAPGRKKKS
jgi:hypothetical protein